jgi:Protein of unknown function (DUF2628)
MSIYTVHQPPLGAADTLPAPEQFAFVRDGFSFWAFVAAALWMLWHRMWLVLLIYLVAAIGAETAMHYAGVPALAVFVAGLFGSLLLGLEAATLRRFTLARRGWKDVGIVSGHDRQDAEQWFFDAWVREAAGKPAAPPTTPSAPPPRPASTVPRLPQSPDVVGLFPKPDASP